MEHSIKEAIYFVGQYKYFFVSVSTVGFLFLGYLSDRYEERKNNNRHSNKVSKPNEIKSKDLEIRIDQNIRIININQANDMLKYDGI
jgi:hypothetical protein